VKAYTERQFRVSSLSPVLGVAFIFFVAYLAEFPVLPVPILALMLYELQVELPNANRSELAPAVEGLGRVMLRSS
jgi:hypothetical protein